MASLDRLKRATALMRSSPRSAPILLTLVVLSELLVLLVRASALPFWYDEVITFHLSSLRKFSSLWSALRAGADGMPPGYYLLVRFARSLPGDPHLALRLASILGYVQTMLGVYWFSRKRLSVSASLAGAILLSLSTFRGYAVEARPYALVAGFVAVAGLLWQRIGERRFLTPLLALFLGLAVSCHYLAVSVLVCFGTAELTLSYRANQIRWGVWSAFLVATVPFFLSLPLLLSFRKSYGKHYWSEPLWSYIAADYLGVGSKLSLLLVILFAMIPGYLLLRRSRSRTKESFARGFRIEEIVFIGALVLYPALLVVASRLLGSGYTPRYAEPAIFGFVLGTVFVCYPALNAAWSGHVLRALLLVFMIQEVRDIRLSSDARSKPADEQWSTLAEVIRTKPDLPVVIGDGQQYLEMAHYAPFLLRDRLVQIVNEDLAVRIKGSDSLDRTNRILSGFVPLHVEDALPFLAAHPRFIVTGGGDLNWTVPYLIEQKYRLGLVQQGPRGSIYIADRRTAE
jgi:hypothetical protein